MPSVGSSTEPLTTIFALLRKPSWALATGGSHGTSSSSATWRCLSTSCTSYGSPSQLHDRQRPASKWEQSVVVMASQGYGREAGHTKKERLTESTDAGRG
jgi:hypothetical protein